MQKEQEDKGKETQQKELRKERNRKEKEKTRVKKNLEENKVTRCAPPSQAARPDSEYLRTLIATSKGVHRTSMTVIG